MKIVPTRSEATKGEGMQEATEREKQAAKEEEEG